MKSMREIGGRIEAGNAAQLAAVEAMDCVVAVTVRCDLIDEFWFQVNEVPGRYSVAPGRVWRAEGIKFRDFLVGSSGDTNFLCRLATQLRWHCNLDGEIGHGFMKARY
jgi:hypothetical protein